MTTLAQTVSPYARLRRHWVFVYIKLDIINVIIERISTYYIGHILKQLKFQNQ